MIPISDPDIRSRSTPYVNIGIIAICAVVFLLELYIGPQGRERLFFQFGLIPRELWEGVSFTELRTPGGIVDIESPIPTWGTVFTSMFIHADILHFAFNMLFLWVFGDNVEDRLGHVKYLLFYLGAGIAAAWLQVAINTDGEIPMIGASGAIAGSLGAYLVLHPFSRIRTLIFMLIIFPVQIPAVALLGFWILIQFFGGLGDLGPSVQTGGTAYWAHVGGFVAGALAILFLKLVVWREQVITGPPRRRGTFWDRDDYDIWRR